MAFIPFVYDVAPPIAGGSSTPTAVFAGMFTGTISGRSNFSPDITAYTDTPTTGITIQYAPNNFTIITAGYYRIYAQQLVAASAAMYFMIRKNGVGVATSYFTGTTTKDLIVSTVLKCEIGDYFDFYISGTQTTGWAGTYHSAISVDLIATT